MEETSPGFPGPPGGHGRLPDVRLELRHGNSRPLLYEVFGTEFLIGTVPGCDLRLPGSDLPPVLCLVSRRQDGVGIRKLAPTYPIEINGKSLAKSRLNNGDQITLGPVNLLIHIAPPNGNPDLEIAAKENGAYGNFDEQQLQVKERERQLHNQINELETDRVIWYRRRDEIEKEGERSPEERRAIASQQVQYHADLLRLDRLASSVEEGERQLQERTQEVDARWEMLRKESRDLEDQAKQVEEWRCRLQKQIEQINLTDAEREAAQADLVRRTAVLETQEAQLASVRSHWERMSAEVLKEEQHLVRHRIRQEEFEAELLQKSRELERRHEELAEIGRAQEEENRRLEERCAAMASAMSYFNNLRNELERDRQQAEDRISAAVEDQQRRLAEIIHKEEVLCQHKEVLNRHYLRIQSIGRTVGQTKKWLQRQRSRLAVRQEQAVEALRQARETYQQLREDATGLQKQIPQWAAQSQATVDQLNRVRHELRGNLAELHSYARQAREDLDQWRSQLKAEADKVQKQRQDLHRGGDEHRLAVAAFRQQLIDWQGQVTELKQSMGLDETRLDQRHAELESTSARLAEQAEEHQARERDVNKQQDEMERHLADMREWYRCKLREMSARFGEDAGRQHCARSANRTESPELPEAQTEPAKILTLTGEIELADRKLGDLLQSLELVDCDTLGALLLETRKQRQSLRQVLLASGFVTLYQMALIEAGNLEGLILGPVRVVDRLRANDRESVYRVLDPRRPTELGETGERYAILRHLAEEDTADAVHPDEFRQRFGAVARLQHPHLAATYEVLEIHGRPAVLQEWVAGLPATDWPPLYSVPGVWCRLLSQAALALQAAHQAGFVHGHLHPRLLVLTTDGILKCHGLGEPLWLADPRTVPENCHMRHGEMEIADDLAALGQIATAWVAVPTSQRKGSKSKSLPGPVRQILDRLNVKAPNFCYPDAAALLADLDQASREIPPNPEAWARLVRHVRENLSEDQGLRQSA
jgi:hypothetical protein